MPECGSGREKVMTSKLEITYYNPPWDFLAYVESGKIILQDVENLAYNWNCDKKWHSEYHQFLDTL